ncbi:hypothetical protein TruAng_010565 [Truncatella angustata]|nr:hypothetical protein TruAng_010565 [Truncatella angustata]
MPLGILEPVSADKVVGTVFLNDASEVSAIHEHWSRLKHGTGKYEHIILAPQPSSDPNDPLNWPRSERILIAGSLLLGTILHGSCSGPLLAAGTYQISLDLKAPVEDVALLAGYNLLSTGAAAPLVSVLSRKYGKRPQYLAASSLAIVAVVVAETARTYPQLLASRIVHGFSTAAYESIVMASIGDLFFVHERGQIISVAQFLLAAVSNGCSIIAGVITARLGWPYNYHILLPFIIVQLLLVVLFCPETSYERQIPSDFNVDSRTGEAGQSTKYHKSHAKEVNFANLKELHMPRMVVVAPVNRDSFFKRMRPFSFKAKDFRVLRDFLALCVILLNLGALFNIVVSGLIIAWYVGITVLVSVLLAAPPYAYTSAEIGYASTGPFIGGVMGFLFMAMVAEPLNNYLIKRNRGVYEPEFRLPLMSVGTAFAVGGLIGVGRSLQTCQSIYVLVTLWGVTLFGITIITIACGQYALDAWRPHSTEIFIMNAAFKNFFFYG